MKDMKSTKTFANFNNNLWKLIKPQVEDTYFIDVVYYHVRRALLKCDYNLKDIDTIAISGKYLGNDIEVDLDRLFNSVLNSLGLAMSLRALMLNPLYAHFIYDDRLLFYNIERNLLSWEAHRAIMECITDKDFSSLYNMMIFYKDNRYLTDKQKTVFEEDTIKPEYHHLADFCKLLADKPDYNGKTVIKSNSFLYSEIEQFSVPKEVDYIGNTVFAFCKNLKEIEFCKKVLFGKFPIIECNNLQRIIVPTNFLSYYKESLPYYEGIITDKEHSDSINEKKETEIKEVKADTIDVLEVKHVYVDVPSAEPYTEIEVPVEEEQTAVTEEEERKPIEVKKLQTVFDKVASSYKFFWMMAIISLAKEKHHLAISFDDITIRMASMAWPIVFEDDIDFGHNDIMKSYLEGVAKKTKLIKAATSNVVENHLKQHYSSQGVDKILSPLMKNVPYRFLSPWIKYTTDAEVIEKSCAKSFNGLYVIHSKYIVLDEEWWDYIYANYNDICDFAMRSFIEYSKKYNNDLKLLKLKTSGWPMIKK